MKTLPATFLKIEQPPSFQVCVDDIFLKQVGPLKQGMVVPQHVHAHDHHTVLVRGAVSVFADGAYQRDYRAPYPILIRAGTQHAFVALEDETLLLCVHNLHGSEEVELLAEAEPLRMEN